MVNKCDLIPMSNADEINKVLILGIKEQLHLFIIDNMTGYPRLLSSGHYFTLPESLKFVSTIRAGLFPGVDTRGRGGFIVAPPSIQTL